MADFDPIPTFNVWNFKQNFLHDPQQKSTRFAHLVMTEAMTGQNQFQNISEQVDGLDYDPADENIRLGNSPMLQFQTRRIGFRKRGHIFGHPVATEDWHTVLNEYQSLVASLAAGSFARFKDRVLLANADSHRLTASTNVTTTQEAFPAANRYAVLNKSESDVTFKTLDLDALRYGAFFFKNHEVNQNNGMIEMPVCVASPHQVQGLLGINQITSADYNTVKALVNGEVDSFMGFKFIQCKAGQTVSASDDVYFKEDVNNVRLTPGTGFSKLATTDNPATTAERVVFCYPSKAFSMGDLPRASYMNVWQNPLRMGTWEFLQKEVIGYKRCQNEYVLVMYAQSSSQAGTVIRKAPVSNTRYWSNFTTDASQWSYTASQA